jgi:PTH1 family peptidyl-tRNA hydrolase
MKVIFTQGNPGDTYTTTRHNVGFLIADTLAGSHAFKSSSKFFADIAEITVEGEKVLLVKPSTFYNETGRSFLALKQFYKLENEDILVVHDELALPFGTIRTRIGGSDAGNNGIKSINAAGGDTTARLRIGVGNELRARIGDIDFVLSKFSKDEQAALGQTILPKCTEFIHHFIAGEFAITSHSEIDNTSPKL